MKKHIYIRFRKLPVALARLLAGCIRLQHGNNAILQKTIKYIKIMKTKVAKKSVVDYFGKNRVLSFGYCKIQGMENYLPQLAKSNHFTAGVYGWNADIYCIEGGGKFFAICTGYRPFGAYDKNAQEIAEKYEKKYQSAEWNEKEAIAREFLDALQAYLQEKETNK